MSSTTRTKRPSLPPRSKSRAPATRGLRPFPKKKAGDALPHRGDSPSPREKAWVRGRKGGVKVGMPKGTASRRTATPAPASEPRSEYPMRINKHLAHKGYATRKQADELIDAGKVMVNGTRAVLGDKVQEHDDVQVLFRTPRSAFIYLAYFKPRGTVTHGAQEGEKEILDHLKKRDASLNVFPVGRLDKNSHGLILLTNDGRIVEPLLSPTRTHEKEYVVKVNERIRSDFAERMARGIDIGGYVTKPCTVERVDAHTFRIILTEGKNHQIKRMADALGYTVRDLKRTRIMNIRIGQLRPNTYRHLTGTELAILLKSLGL